jgi:hypothetical protein
MAVATRQKSTARRFVSISAALEGTYSMLCTAGTDVTTRSVVTVLANTGLANTGLANTGLANTEPIVA